MILNSLKTSLSKILFTCEHATSNLPSSYHYSLLDKHLINKHWSADHGTSELTSRLCDITNSPGILGQYSRLLIDINRPLNSETLIRQYADNIKIDLNNNITKEETQYRILNYYHPYHSKLAELVKLHKPKLLISIHGYTDNYEGNKRDVEIGVLYNKDDSIAIPLNTYFKNLGYNSKLNEPWSGKDGYMYSVENAAGEEKSLMLEFRQDLLLNNEWREKVANHLYDFLLINKHL